MAGFGVAVAGEDLYVSATVPVAADGTVSFTTTGTVDVTVDVVGVLVRPVDTWTYGYRSDGLRSSKQEAGSAPIEFSWDSSGGLPLLLAQHQGSAASYLVYGPGGTVVYQVRQDGSVLNLHHDQLGSTRLVTIGSNGSAYGTVSYDAYGRITSDSTPWFLERPLVGYTGQYHDTETGLEYLRARYYQPSTGQFLTRDPIVGVTQEPYGYTGGNPANATDVSGLFGVPEWLPVIGGRCVDGGAIPGVDQDPGCVTRREEQGGTLEGLRDLAVDNRHTIVNVATSGASVAICVGAGPACLLVVAASGALAHKASDYFAEDMEADYSWSQSAFEGATSASSGWLCGVYLRMGCGMAAYGGSSVALQILLAKTVYNGAYTFLERCMSKFNDH
jgi:RHS repeat-associated protein